MSTTAVVILIIVLVLIVAGAVLFELQRRRRLQQQFGPEYQRTVEREGGQRAAERDLSQRAQRHEELDVRPLDPRTRDAYAEQWRRTQAHFVDTPSEAVHEADDLVARVLQERGYPVGDFNQQERDVSVEHAHVVSDYRTAHDISMRDQEGLASTEDLRTAMVHYRTLFADLLVVDSSHEQRNRGAEA
ncbi:MAG: hypothetical protein JWM02_1418 [Frankiales bacterium]|nr:hypothetical protein [Frankiales bacterium]